MADLNHDTDIRRVIKLESDDLKIRAIIQQLCSEFIGTTERASRSASGGLIGLAAATIALGKHSANYLDLIVPAVLSCFASQDSRIRYYSTESLYNIAKVAKGEVLLYFNEVFDMLCKVCERDQFLISLTSRSLLQTLRRRSRMAQNCLTDLYIYADDLHKSMTDTVDERYCE